MALSLNLSRIHYAYPDAPSEALSDVSAAFGRGWTGIVGDNGCGKSTLARIACGLITPDAGTVSPRLSFAYCAQDATTPPEALFDFACDFAPEAQRLRRVLNIEDDMPWRFAELSCGEQKKIQIATALWMQPELLVVDEPTNHVDAACREEIRAALADYQGIGLLISHDRALLDALATRCLAFEGGRAIMRAGTYSQTRKQADADRKSMAHQRESAKADVRKLAAEAAQRSALADRTAARRSARHLDKHDNDARAKIKLAIYTGQDGKAGALASRMDARVQRAQEKLDGIRVAKRYEGDLWLEAQPHPRKTLLHLRETSIPCGPGRTLRVPELYLGNTDHLGLCGPNGAGKTTLVRHIMGLLHGDAGEGSRKTAATEKQAGAPIETAAPGKAAGGRDEACALEDHLQTICATLPNATSSQPAACDFEVLFIPQEMPENEAARVLADIKRMPAAERGRLLSIVAQLDSDPDRILSGGHVSPGELRKLLIARGIMARPSLIVMDEPTNHLDLHSVEALERALAAYPGALVLVSHDEAFLEAACTMRLILDPGVDETCCRLAK